MDSSAAAPHRHSFGIGVAGPVDPVLSLPDEASSETHHVATTTTTTIDHRPNTTRQRSRTGSNASRLLVTDAPPFWTTTPPRPTRSFSALSHGSLHRPAAILLEDHSSEHNEHTQSCWARSVRVDDYVVVSGRTGVGAYVVWHCTVGTLEGGNFILRKRYVLERVFGHIEWPVN